MAVQEIEVDAAPLEALRADLLQMTVPQGSRMHGVYVRELRLPEGTGLSLVVRRGASFTPQADTRIQEGDQLLVVATAFVTVAFDLVLAVGVGVGLASLLALIAMADSTSFEREPIDSVDVDPALEHALLHEHIVGDGERPDTLADRYLNDPEQFWRICDANAVMAPNELTQTVGRVVRITLPPGIPAPRQDV